MEKIELLHGDCLEMLKHIPDGSVDVVLTDPPYSSGGMYAGGRKRSTKDKYTSTDYKGASRFNSFSGDNMDMRAYAEHMRMVLDPFMGSGSTGEACIKTGRKFIGIEMDEYYFMVAKNRLEELTK